MMLRPKLKDYLILHSILLMYSLIGILSKTTAKFEFLSFKFIFYYTIILSLLFVYAIMWQQVLKKFPLNTAFANKSIVIVWGIIWGHIFFTEKITLFMVIGAVVILVGLTFVVTADE